MDVEGGEGGGEEGVGVEGGGEEDAGGWGRVRTCCKRLGVAAVEWVAVEEAQESAGRGGSGDVEAEAFANVERELGAVLSAAALAGGRRMFAAQVPKFHK